MTAYGLSHLLVSKHVTANELQAGLLAMGYDEYLLNAKSRAFVLSIHSSTPISSKIGDALSNNYQQIANNLLHDAFIKADTHAAAREETNFALLANQHPDCTATTFVLVNKS